MPLAQDQTSRDLSVVIPMYNEDQSVLPLIEELEGVLQQTNLTYEILCIDDGSADQTSQRIQEAAKQNSDVRAISLLCNTQKSGALHIGFQLARGKNIVTMDGDLQDDPAEIPRLLEGISEGYACVTGWKKIRNDSWYKKNISTMMNWLTSIILGRRFHDMNSGLKAYRADVAQTLELPSGHYRFIPHLLTYQGYKVKEIPVHHRPRQYGNSKYGTLHRFGSLIDLATIVFVTKFGDRPLHFFGGIGSIFTLIGAGFFVHLGYIWYFELGSILRPFLIVATCISLIGIQIISVGLIGEILVHHHPRGVFMPRFTEWKSKTIPKLSHASHLNTAQERTLVHHLA